MEDAENPVRDQGVFVIFSTKMKGVLEEVLDLDLAVAALLYQDPAPLILLVKRFAPQVGDRYGGSKEMLAPQGAGLRNGVFPL